MLLGKPQQRPKFEIASFSRCRNIIGEPKNFGEVPEPKPRPLRLAVILLWALTNLSGMQNLKSLASAVAEILKGNPQILGSSPTPGPHPVFPLVGFNDGPLQTPSACQL